MLLIVLVLRALQESAVFHPAVFDWKVNGKKDVEVLGECGSVELPFKAGWCNRTGPFITIDIIFIYVHIHTYIYICTYILILFVFFFKSHDAPIHQILIQNFVKRRCRCSSVKPCSCTTKSWLVFERKPTCWKRRREFLLGCQET